MRVLAAILTLIVLPLATAPAAELVFHEIRANDGVPLNVVEAGNPDGPPVLLLHGAYQSYLSWLLQLRDPQLTRSFRLVALDMRGHGGSGKPWAVEAYAGSKPWADDIAAVLQALDIERPTIVGWSFGGFVVMDYLREYGNEALSGAMLIGSHGGLRPRPPGGSASPAAGSDLEALREDAQRFAAAMSARPLTDELVALTESAFLMMPAYARTAFRSKRLDNTDLVDDVRIPLLFTLGSEELLMAGNDINELLQRIPTSSLRIYEGVGHSPFYEATEQFNADLACFVSTGAACEDKAR